MALVLHFLSSPVWWHPHFMHLLDVPLGPLLSAPSSPSAHDKILEASFCLIRDDEKDEVRERNRMHLAPKRLLTCVISCHSSSFSGISVGNSWQSWIAVNFRMLS